MLGTEPQCYFRVFWKRVKHLWLGSSAIAKRILDYGFYAPTIYFPLVVNGALMIEPTETESKDSLDKFVEVMNKIYEEALNEPEKLKNAPSNTSIGRLDAVNAARKPILHD